MIEQNRILEVDRARENLAELVTELGPLNAVVQRLVDNLTQNLDDLESLAYDDDYND